MIDLTKFCASADHYRDELKKPFNAGQHSCAADGVLSIRVPKRTGIKSGSKKISARLVNLFAEARRESTHYIDLPEYTCLLQYCVTCMGSGTVDTCEERDGQGRVSLETPYNDYRAKCITCNGGKKTENHECHRCDGTGHPYGIAITHLANDIYADACKLDKLKAELPGLKISLDRDPTVAIHFKFDGGDGLLMPCRNPDGDKNNATEADAPEE